MIFEIFRADECDILKTLRHGKTYMVRLVRYVECTGDNTSSGRGKHGAYNSLVKDPTFYGSGANGVPSIVSYIL